MFYSIIYISPDLLGVNVTILPQVHPNQDGSSPNFQSPNSFLHEITANKRPTDSRTKRKEG